MGEAIRSRRTGRRTRGMWELYRRYFLINRDEIVAAYRRGRNYEALSWQIPPLFPTHWRTPPVYIARFLREEGIECLHPPVRTEEVRTRLAEAARLRQQGMKLREIGAHFGVSKARAGQLVARGNALQGD